MQWLIFSTQNLSRDIWHAVSIMIARSDRINKTPTPQMTQMVPTLLTSCTIALK